MGASRLRFLAAALGLGLVLAIVAGSAGLLGGSPAFAGGTTLTVIGGDVSVRHGTADFVAAADGEVLSPGDAIRTGASGRAVLTYFEGSTVTIEPGTELAIDTASTAQDGGTVVLMTQTAGRTWHVVTKLITGSSKYEVRTPASTASVRGTEFQVDSSNDATTVTTTEGTVVQHVPDPASPSSTVDVPVTAGTTQTQTRNTAPAPARTAPDPGRKVTVTVGAANTLVVDPVGRANGVTRDGKLVVQTPGAQVRRDGDRIIVTLPNVPDGKLTTRIDKKDDTDNGDVAVTARVEEQGRALDLQDNAKVEGAKKVAGFEIRKRDDGNTGTRALEDTETTGLPEAKVADARRASSTGSPEPSQTLRASRTPEPTASPRSTERSATPTALRTPELRTLAPRTDSPRTDAPRTDAPRTDSPRTESPRVESQRPSASPRADATAAPTSGARASDAPAASGAALVTRLVIPKLPSAPLAAAATARVDASHVDHASGPPPNVAPATAGGADASHASSASVISGSGQTKRN